MSLPTEVADICTICLTGIVDNDEDNMYTTCCNNRFHKTCYDTWCATNVNANCPLCRKANSDLRVIEVEPKEAPEVVVQVPVVLASASTRSARPSYDCSCNVTCSSLRGMLFSTVWMLGIFGFLGLMAWIIISRRDSDTHNLFPPPSHN